MREWWEGGSRRRGYATATEAKSLQSCPTLCGPHRQLSHFSHVRLCATPQTAAQQASPSLGFPRQEHWSGLPFPSPMHESESEVAQSCPTLATPWTAAYQAPPSMGFSRQEYWSDLPLVRGFYYQPVAGILGSACRGCPCKGAREAGLCRRRS